MKTARERAGELAREYFDSIDNNIGFSNLINTLTPLLEEIDAARKWRDMENYDWRIDRSVKDKYKFAYDAIRKRNEGLNE